MAKLNVAQTAFSAGELSPGMYGRSDLREHSEGAKTISNFIVRPQGGLTRRPGSIFAGASLADDQTRLIPFPVTGRRFLIEMGNGFLRVWEETNGNLNLFPTNTAYTFPAVTSSAWDTPGTHSWVLNMNQLDFPIASGMGPYAITTTGTLPAAISGASPNLFLHVRTDTTTASAFVPNYDNLEAPIVITFYDNYTDSVVRDPLSDNALSVSSSNGTGTHTLTTQNPGFETETSTNPATGPIRWARSDDTLWIADTEEGLSYPVYKIRYYEKKTGKAYSLTDTEIGDGRIVIERIDAAQEGPFHTISNTTDHDSPIENLEWTEDVGGDLTVSGRFFTLAQTNVGHGATSLTGLERPSDANRPLGVVYGRERIGGSSDSLGVDTNWGVGVSAVPTLAATQDGSMLRPFTRGATRIDADLFAFGPMFTSTERLRSIELFQGRVALSGGIRPGTISFGSLEVPMLFIPANVDGTTIDGDTSFQLSIQGDQDQKVNSMISTHNKLFVITQFAVYSIGRDSAGLFEFDKFSIIPVNRIPGKDAQGISFGDFAGYITADGRRIMVVDVNNEGIKFNTFDITRFADHILEPGAHTLAHQRIPGSLIWSVLDDGTMASITFSREEGIIAAASHAIAGSTVEVEDAVSMPFHDGTDVVYLAVKRVINSTTKRYIERIDAIPKYSTAIEDYVLLDSAGIYDSSAVTNVPANTFDHLNGETVDVYADGVHVGTKVISGGVFTVALTTAASKIYAGYKYNSDVEMFRPVESFPAFGTTEGSLKRNIAVVTQFSNTYGGQAGSSASDLEPIKYESDTPSLITDELETPVTDEHKRDATLLIRANQPYPMDITSVIRRVDFESRGGE